MKNNNSIKTVAAITIATIIGKILGILKDSLISYYYGTSRETDAFFLALSIPTILLGVFTASTDSAIIPQYTRIMQSDSKESADRLFFSILNTLIIICTVFCIAILCVPQLFIKLFAPGFEATEIAIAAGYLKVFAAVGIFHMLYCFLCTYNAAHKRNTARAILSFSTNLIVVISVLILHGNDLYYLAVAYLFANIISGILPLIEMRRVGYTYSWRIEYKNEEYRKFWILFMPIMGGALLNDIQQFVDKNLCSGIDGGISYLNYGSKLVNIFDSVLVVGIAVVLLPMLSNINVNNNVKEFSTVGSKVTRYLLEILVPVFAVLYTMATPLVTLLFGRGKFDQTSIAEVSLVLQVYSGLIVLMPAITIFSKFFHAKEMNKIPFILGLIAVVANTGLSIVLKSFFGVQGVAAATTIASLIEVVLFVVIIGKVIGWNKDEMSISVIFKLAIPTAVSILIGVLLDGLFENYLLKLIVKAIMIMIVYGCCYFAMFKEDVKFFVSKAASVVSRK